MIKNTRVKIILVLVVFLVAGFIRLYNFPARVNFGPEQAISLSVSGDFLNGKLSLLGQPNIQRTTSNGHIIYSPVMFNYSLMPLLAIFRYDPLLATYYFAFLNLSTGLVLYLLTKKIFGFNVALFALILFLFEATMIYHSTFIWTHNYIPILNIFVFYLLYRFRKAQKIITPFLLGLLTSFSLSPEYFYIFTMIAVFGLMFYFSKNKLRDTAVFGAGAILGSFPTILFDIKHQFYHLSTLWQYALDTFSKPGQHSISYYHFLQFWPLAAVLGGILLSKLVAKKKLLAFGLLVAYLFLNLTSDKVSLTQAVGVNKGISMADIDKAAGLIAADNPQNFNVASTLSFDSTRAYPLRYFLQFKYKVAPSGVEGYKGIKSLYVLTDKSHDFKSEATWEITVQEPYTLETLKNLNQNYSLYKLNHKQ